MPPLRQRMIEDLQLRGLSERTPEMYVRAVRPLADYYHQSPEQITEEELRDYVLYLKNVTHYFRAASPIALCGIKFCDEHTLKQPWPTLRFVRPPREQTRPVVLSLEEVRTVRAHLKLFRYRACRTTIYSWGLRRQEGTHRPVPDIDSARMLVHVRGGMGAKDRYVPLPPQTLVLLRQYWCTHRPPLWLFPAPGRSGLGMATATAPMPRHSVQDALRAALKASGLNKRASVHTLRHSYATPLLEAGVHLRLIQAYLGHTTPTTTALYTPLPATTDATAREALAALMGDRYASREVPMIERAEIFRRHGPAYRAKCKERGLPSHLAAMQAMEQCRTEALGGHLYQCPDCGELE